MKDSIKKIINYIKENKFYLIIMLIGFILLLFQMRNVVMYADDFGLKMISSKGFRNIINNQIKHYFNWGGGFTPILVTSFLLFKFNVWKIFISALITAVFFLIIKMLNLNKQKEKVFVSLFLWSLFYFISSRVLSQTVYWLDGCFAYVFTALQVILYVYFVVTRIFNKKEKDYDKIIFPIVAFFGGWSSAQTGAIVLLLPILIIGYFYIVKKEKISKINMFSLIMGMIGFVIFYFAPGNSSRMGAMSFFSDLSFIEKILYRIPTIFRYLLDFKNVSFNSAPFYILLLSSFLIILISSYLKKEKGNNLIIKFSYTYTIVMLIIYMLIAMDVTGADVLVEFFISFVEFTDSNVVITCFSIVPYVLSFLYLLSILILMFYTFLKSKSSIGIVALLSAYISQGVMIMSPYTEYRTMLIMILFLIIAILDVIKNCYKEKVDNYYMCCIPFIIYQLQFGLAILIIILIFNSFIFRIKPRYLQLLILLSMFILGALSNYFNTYVKYSENRKIYSENISKLEKYNGEDTIYIKKFLYDDCSFADIIGYEWIENDVKELYGIDKNVKFLEDK